LEAYAGAWAKPLVDPIVRDWKKDIMLAFKGIVFWRPILNEKPLVHMPLTVLDRNTVKI
jgi:hypothetical protein